MEVSDFEELVRPIDFLLIFVYFDKLALLFRLAQHLASKSVVCDYRADIRKLSGKHD